VPIRYVHNDPASVPFLETERVPLGPRTGHLARFDVTLPAAEIYDLGTPEFVDRQCFEAALRTLEVWETVSTPFRYWHNQQRSIVLKPRRQTGFGGAYERTKIGFDYHPVADPSMFVGASADAVSHEIGHAILDAKRPELWDSFFAEVAAFHEGFADCVSLLVALLDDTIVNALFRSAPQPIDVLSEENRVSQVAESVALHFRSVHGAQSASSVPRRLRNDFQWAIPSTLPANPTSKNLAREPHSFGRVFAGCFYDCINNIYRHGGVHTAAGLRNAAISAGTVLSSAIESAPEEVRFFRSVGRAMIHADTAADGGANHVQIRDAFNAHNVHLGSAAMLAPSASLDGPAPPRRGSSSRQLNARTRKDLARHAGLARGATVSTTTVRVGSDSVVRAKMQQPVVVNVRSSDGRLINVSARASQDALLGGQRGRCVVLGEIPNRFTAVEEVNSFVETLADHGDLLVSKGDRSNTHNVRKRGQRFIVRRVRFSCCR
jgi:hypothetical protein